MVPRGCRLNDEERKMLWMWEDFFLEREGVWTECGMKYFVDCGVTRGGQIHNSEM